MTEISSHAIFAHTLADTAGDILRRYYRAPCPVTIKADDSPVTQADRDVEAALRQLIMQQFPAHGIIGEEQSSHQTDADYCWVIDPIDGTRAFMAGMPTFTTLIALLHHGKPLLGVIDQPITRDRWAASGIVTTLNGTRVSTRTCTTLSTAILATTSPHFFSEQTFIQFESLRAKTKDCIYGKDGLAYALLASGHIDLVCESGLKSYDIMALIPIIQGAGGIITDWHGAPVTLQSTGNVLAAGDKTLHSQALAVLNSASASVGETVS